MKTWKRGLCLWLALTLALAALMGGCNTGKDDSMDAAKGTKATALAEPPAIQKSETETQNGELNPDFLKAVIAFCADSTALAAGLGEENLAFSPVSLYMALAMSSMGAEGTTLEEMQKAFHMEGMDKEAMAEESKKMFESLYFDNDIGKTYLANSIWVDDQLDVKEDFYKRTAGKFYAPAYHVDLQDRAAQESISQWVEEKTNGKVSRPVPEEVPDTMVMSLINAIYFIDQWQSQFKAEMTEPGQFTLPNSETVDADFMNQRLSFASYQKTKDYDAVEMPFANGYSMTFYRPSEGKTAESLLAEKLIFGEMDVLPAFKTVDIRLPKFDIQSTLDLTPLLSSLGMTSAVDENSANFIGISDPSPYISSVAQSAAITVDENGCEAAAYTEVMMEVTGLLEEAEIVEFVLDRPFVFALTDSNRVPLFTGLVNNPVT